MTGTGADRKRYLAVAACALAYLTLNLDIQMVVSTLPRLGHDLGLSPTTAVWLLLAGSITSVALMLPVGRWADASGKRSAFLLGSAGYAVAAAAAALAPSVPFLLGARALSGAFLALLVVVVMTVAMDAAGPADTAKAIGVITAAGPLGSMTGPQLAAVFIPMLGWRGIFLLTLVFSLVTTVAAWFSVPGEVHLAPPRRRWIVEALALSFAIGSGFGLLRMIPIGLDRVAPAAGLLLLLVAGAVGWSRLPQAHGIARLVAARRLSLPLASLAAIALAGGLLAYAIPYYLLGELRASLAAAAVAFIALAFGQTASSILGGLLTGRLGPWPVAIAGAVIGAAGLALLAPLDPAWGVSGVAWRLGVVGFGAGLAGGCNQSTIMGLAPWHHEAAASAVSGVFRNLWYAVGAALAATSVSLAGDPATGLRLTMILAVLTGLFGVLAAARSRRLMAHLGEHVHHPAPHLAHAPLHNMRGLGHDPDHPDYVAPTRLPKHPHSGMLAEAPPIT